MELQNDEAPAVSAAEASDDVTSLPSKIDRYGKARQRATEMMRYLTARGKCSHGLPSRSATVVAEKLRMCGNRLRFRHYYRVGKVKLVEAMFCRTHLVCPLCSLRRAGKALRAYNERLAVIRTADMDVMLVTCTVRNGEDLEERFEHLRKAWKLLLHRRGHSEFTGVSVLREAVGGVASFEITKGEQTGWHPHLHALVLVPKGIDADEFRGRLRAEWEAITGDSFECDARFVTDEVGAFLEVLKYALKFSDLSLPDNWEAYLQLRGRRLLTSFGLFRGVVVPRELTDEPLPEDEPYIEILYRYMWGAQSYTVESVTEPHSSEAASAESASA